MQNSEAPSSAVCRAASSTCSVSRNGVARTGVSNRDDWAQKWQSSGQPPVLADRMPSTSTVSPHQARRVSWARAARDGTRASGTAASSASCVAAESLVSVDQLVAGRVDLGQAGKSGHGLAW